MKNTHSASIQSCPSPMWFYLVILRYLYLSNINTYYLHLFIQLCAVNTSHALVGTANYHMCYSIAQVFYPLISPDMQCILLHQTWQYALMTLRRVQWTECTMVYAYGYSYGQIHFHLTGMCLFTRFLYILTRMTRFSWPIWWLCQEINKAL